MYMHLTKKKEGKLFFLESDGVKSAKTDNYDDVHGVAAWGKG